MNHNINKKHILVINAAIIALILPIALTGCSNNNQSKPKTAHVAKKDDVKVGKATIDYLDKERRIDQDRGGNSPRNSDKKFNDAREKVRVWKKQHTLAQWKYYIKHSDVGPEIIKKGESSEFDVNKVPLKDVVQLGIAVNESQQESSIANTDSEQKTIERINRDGKAKIKAFEHKYGDNTYGLSLIELSDAWTNSDGTRGRTIKKQVEAGLVPIKQQVGAGFETTQYYQQDN